MTMKQRNRITALLLGLVLLLGLGVWCSNRRAEAEGVNVFISLSSMEVKKGETVTVTVHVSGDDFSSVSLNLSYPAGILEYSGGQMTGGNGTLKASFTGAGSLSASFKAKAEGSARVSTNGGSATDADGNTMTIAHAGVTIEVLPGQGGTTETKVTTEKASDGTTEKASDDASTEEADTEEPGELPDGIVKVENPEEVPLGYTETTAEYKNREIPAYESPNKVIKIVARADQDGNISWYQLKTSTGELIPYVEYSASASRYILLDKPSNVQPPEGFTEGTYDFGHGEVPVYRSEDLKDVVLVYCVSLQGVEGFYYYDTIEGSFFRYVQLKQEKVEEASTEKTTEKVTEALPEPTERKTKEDEGIFTRDNLIKMLIGAVGLFLVMAVLAIILMVKNAKLQGIPQEEDAEEESPIRRIVRNGEEYGEDPSDEEDEEYGEMTEGSGDGTEDRKEDSAPDGTAAGKSEVTGETIEIILEAAEDNNQSVHVPPAEDPEKTTLEDALKTRPYGIDSAFDVVNPEQVDKTEESHVKSEERQRVALPAEEEDEEDAE